MPKVEHRIRPASTDRSRTAWHRVEQRPVRRDDTVLHGHGRAAHAPQDQPERVDAVTIRPGSTPSMSTPISANSASTIAPGEAWPSAAIPRRSGSPSGDDHDPGERRLRQISEQWAGNAPMNRISTAATSNESCVHTPNMAGSPQLLTFSPPSYAKTRREPGPQFWTPISNKSRLVLDLVIEYLAADPQSATASQRAQQAEHGAERRGPIADRVSKQNRLGQLQRDVADDVDTRAMTGSAPRTGRSPRGR